jgi:hypothetical protein
VRELRGAWPGCLGDGIMETTTPIVFNDGVQRGAMELKEFFLEVFLDYVSWITLHYLNELMQHDCILVQQGSKVKYYDSRDIFQLLDCML